MPKEKGPEWHCVIVQTMIGLIFKLTLCTFTFSLSLQTFTIFVRINAFINVYYNFLTFITSMGDTSKVTIND